MLRVNHRFGPLEPGAQKERISSFWFPIIVALYCGVFYACYLKHYSLPTPNLSGDLSTPKFNSRSARGYLADLTSFGPKPAGSTVNERDVVEFLLAAAKKIRREMHPNHEMDIDVQVARGSLFVGLPNNYEGVQNVVVRLRNSYSRDPNVSLLLNSHFDTAPEGPGAGDASTGVSVLLETLRVLATQEETFEHGIIFLFNGAEEIGLMGAHAFITQHKWADSVKAFLNVDSGGNGGRDLVFRMPEGHAWLTEYYKKYAPHPFSTIAAQELFHLVPSDSDYRIFRDYGEIPGLDIGQITNSYVYHTALDRPEIVPDGTLQHGGDNILALTRALANAKELFDTDAAHVEGQNVFFDFMNWFMVSYSEYEAILFTVVIAVLCVGLQWFSCYLNGKDESNSKLTVPVNLLVQLSSTTIGFGAAIGLSLFYNAINTGMSWYHNSFLIFPLFMCPMFFFMALGPAVMRRFSGKITPWDSVEHGLNLHSWLLLIALIVMTGLGFRTGFMLLVPLFAFVVSLIVQIVLKFFRIGARIKLIVFYFVQLVPFAFFSTWTMVAFAIFIPVAGRAYTDFEMIISVFAVGLGLVLAGFLIPTIAMFKNPIGVSMTFAVLWLLGVIISTTPLGFPYANDTAPQRMFAQHIHRNFFNYAGDMQKKDSFFFVSGFGPHLNLAEEYLNLSERIEVASECSKPWVCGLPSLSNRNSYFLKASRPNIQKGESYLRVTIKKQISEDNWIYTFSLICPTYCEVHLKPLNAFNSSGTVLKYHNLHLKDPPNFILSYGIRRKENDAPGPVLRAQVESTYYTTDKEHYLPEYRDLLNQFPDWTTLSEGIVTIKIYEF